MSSQIVTNITKEKKDKKSTKGNETFKMYTLHMDQMVFCRPFKVVFAINAKSNVFWQFIP